MTTAPSTLPGLGNRKEEYAFLTNHLDLSALEVAEPCRRWQIELEFWWIKHNPKKLRKKL